VIDLDEYYNHQKQPSKPRDSVMYRLTRMNKILNTRLDSVMYQSLLDTAQRLKMTPSAVTRLALKHELKYLSDKESIRDNKA